MQRVKVAVSGAAGQIGYALLFRIAAGEVFGQQTEVELQLLELPSSLTTLEGVVMELEDCAFPLLKNIVYTSELAEVMQGANWVILVGAVPRKQGMERADLLEINGGIFTAQGKAINDHAANDVGVFVVGNPCNTNCLITMHHAPDIPSDRFFAMTMLDELRAKSQLAKRAKVDVNAVSNMTIWGNHSSTQFPDFYHAKINDQSALDVIDNEKWLKHEFIQTIQQRGAAVIKARGSSSAASAANAIITSLRCLSQDHYDDVYSVCRCSQGEYDIDPGLIFSFPCVTKDGKVQVVKGLTHNEFAAQKLQQTLQELRDEYQTVKELGLID